MVALENSASLSKANQRIIGIGSRIYCSSDYRNLQCLDTALGMGIRIVRYSGARSQYSLDNPLASKTRLYRLGDLRLVSGRLVDNLGPGIPNEVYRGKSEDGGVYRITFRSDIGLAGRRHSHRIGTLSQPRETKKSRNRHRCCFSAVCYHVLDMGAPLGRYRVH